MKSPDETKKGLECCSISYADCNNECPYKSDCDGSQILKDALALIQQLQAENAKKDETIQMLQDGNARLMRMIDEECEKTVQLEAERDAMMQDMNRSCFICKHFNSGVECLNTVCAKCVRWCNWEWRGVQKEE
jgi:hypothetical protein